VNFAASAQSTTVLKYHQFRAKLSMGDLHPGGVPATEIMLRWLLERGVRRVLEVGAGIGNTARRMAALGWQVTAIEPDPILFAQLNAVHGIDARCESFLAHTATHRYDAVIAESVLFQMSIPQSFAHARGLLRPGGYLAFVEAVWSAGITAEVSSRLHDTTERLFGIPLGSRDPLTWQDWSKHLRDSGFDTVCAQPLPRGAAGHAPSINWSRWIAAVACDPRLLIWLARYRARKRLVAVPAGAQESWIFLGQACEPKQPS
jgi:SAM-dependent methyltransferase